MPAENKDIRKIVDDSSFKSKMIGCCIAKSESIAADNASSANEKSWASKLLGDSSVLYNRRSSMVAFVSQLVVRAEMLANPAKEPSNIIVLPEAQITAHIDSYIDFIADNQPS